MGKNIIKKVTLVIALVVAVSQLSCCHNKHIKKSLITDLNDELNLEFYLTGGWGESWMEVEISSASIKNKCYICDWSEFVYELPDNILESFETIGAFGNTHFYKIFNTVFYVYDSKLLWKFSPQYDISDYENDTLYSTSDEYTYHILPAMYDLIQSGNFEYIYQFGTILSHEKYNDMKPVLERYVQGEFTEIELMNNSESGYSTEDIQKWAKEMLEKYYS